MVGAPRAPSVFAPGIRVEPDFVTEDDAVAIAAELVAASDAYGYAYDGDSRVHLLSSSGSGDVEATRDGVVNNMRVTGRLERPDLGDAVLPPWSYGDAFDRSALPPALARLAEKIATCGKFRGGDPRERLAGVQVRSASGVVGRPRRPGRSFLFLLSPRPRSSSRRFSRLIVSPP